MEAEPEGFGVWPVNMPIVDAFLSVCSQWRTTGLADGRVLWHGLDYTAVKVGLEQGDLTISPADWSAFRLMERVAASALNGNRG
nr:DUF1799 domain-containing protein [Sphingomonas sp. CROZ-RG-20F-R02-07]